MPRFRVTVKQMKNSGGVRIEPGMQVDFVSPSFSNPISTNRGQAVVDAFMRVYGVDMRAIGALNTVYLDVQQIG